MMLKFRTLLFYKSKNKYFLLAVVHINVFLTSKIKKFMFNRCDVIWTLKALKKEFFDEKMYSR